MNLDQKKKEKTPLGIYIHIPFCIKKCDYCDFLSMPVKEDIKNKYLISLSKEIRKKITPEIFENFFIDTIFVGGGTPSALSVVQLEKLCEDIKFIVDFQNKYTQTDLEITMECNPGTLNEEKVKILKKFGINRISLGLQSANDNELKLLGRIHKYDDFLYAYELLRSVGIENINVDLMSALPGQTVESYVQTLRKIAQLKPEHISAYSLIIEEGTLFYERYREDEKKRDAGEIPEFLPDEESERQMYILTEKILEEYGYHRYEISNYAKMGCECRHNIKYWTQKPYLGFGLGAVSMLDNNLNQILNNENKYCRQSNTSELDLYICDNFSAYETVYLSEKMLIEEFMFMGLRMMRGISEKEFENKFDKPVYEVYNQAIEQLFDKGFLKKDTQENIALTKEGIDVSNYVFAQFLM